MLKTFSLIIYLILLTGCASTQIPETNPETNTTQSVMPDIEQERLNDANTSIVNEINFQEVQWQVIGINGKAIMVQEGKPYIKLKLDNHRLQGFGGCNLLFGTYTLDTNATVRFPMIASTKRACQNLELENEFFIMLSKVESYAIQEGVLLFFDKSHRSIATFEALD